MSQVQCTYKMDKELINDFIYSIKFYCADVEKICTNEGASKVVIYIESNGRTGENKAKIDYVYQQIIKKTPIAKTNLYINRAKPKYSGNINDELSRSALVTQRGNGLISFKGVFLELYRIFDNFFVDFAARLKAEEVTYPTLLQIKNLDKCSYITSFAQYLTYATHLIEDFDKVRAYINSRHPDNMANPIYALTPAVCLHCYIGLENTTLDIQKPHIITTKGKCFRYESSNLDCNTRLWDFTMREIVFLGSEEAIEEMRQKSMQFVKELVESLELDCFIETASDPFFIDIKTKEYFQLLTKVKYELRMNIPYKNNSIAVASFNIHGNHFGRSYNITTQTGSHINTGCTAFGIERWVYAFLSQYGLDISLWPPLMRSLIEARREFRENLIA